MLNRNKFLLSSLAAAALLTGCNTADLKTARRAAEAGDTATARATYEELAAYGIAEAQLEMATLTLAGRPTQAEAQAAMATLDAAAKDNASMSIRIGDLYEDGKVVPRNLILAYKYYSQAFDLGSPKAAYKIGSVLMETPSNNELAKAWLKKALVAGDAKAALKLGRLYEKGAIADRSPAKALGYYAYAQANGIEVGESINRLKAKTSAADIQAGVQFARDLSSGVSP